MPFVFNWENRWPRSANSSSACIIHDFTRLQIGAYDYYEKVPKTFCVLKDYGLGLGVTFIFSLKSSSLLCRKLHSKREDPDVNV